MGTERLNYLKKLLSSKDESERRNAVIRLAELKTDEAYKLILKAAFDKSLIVRYYANLMLSKLQPSFKIPEKITKKLNELEKKDSIPSINISVLEKYLNDPAKDKRIKATKAATMSEDPRALLPILMRLEIEKDAEVKKYLLEAIAKLGSMFDVPKLLKALSDAHSDVRVAIIKTLFKICDEEMFIDIIGKAILDPDSKVKTCILDFLNTIPQHKIFQRLEENLKSGNLDLKISTLNTLKVLDKKLPSIKLLLHALEDKNDKIFKIAYNILQDIDSKDAKLALKKHKNRYFEKIDVLEIKPIKEKSELLKQILLYLLAGILIVILILIIT